MSGPSYYRVMYKTTPESYVYTTSLFRIFSAVSAERFRCKKNCKGTLYPFSRYPSPSDLPVSIRLKLLLTNLLVAHVAVVEQCTVLLQAIGPCDYNYMQCWGHMHIWLWDADVLTVLCTLYMYSTQLVHATA